MSHKEIKYPEIKAEEVKAADVAKGSFLRAEPEKKIESSLVEIDISSAQSISENAKYMRLKN